MRPRFWLTFMAGPGSLQDLRELWEPLRHLFDGLVCTYHGAREDEEARYLEGAKGAGTVVYLPYARRHSFSRNAYLYCGGMQDGDWCFQHDVLERANPAFIEQAILPFIAQWKPGGINALYYYGKILLYQFHESLHFEGSPHEGLRRDDGLWRPADITAQYPHEPDVRWNVRPLRRPDPHHFVDHYARYWVDFPWGSNHCLLGWEKKSGEEIQAREQRRLAFRQLVRARGYPVTLAGVKQLFAQPLDAELAAHINGELILHDLYRHHVLGERWMTDRHDVASIRPVAPISLDTPSQPPLTQPQ